MQNSIANTHNETVLHELQYTNYHCKTYHYTRYFYTNYHCTNYYYTKLYCKKLYCESKATQLSRPNCSLRSFNLKP